MPETAMLHATCVSVGGRGVLLLGPPGSGKSSLALRLIDQPGTGISGQWREARLVADDQVVVRRDGGRLVAAAPPALTGKLEIRGLGIAVVAAALPEVTLDLAVRLTPAEDIARMPEAEPVGYEILGVDLPLVLIDPDSAAAPAKVRTALDLW